MKVSIRILLTNKILHLKSKFNFLNKIKINVNNKNSNNECSGAIVRKSKLLANKLSGC